MKLKTHVLTAVLVAVAIALFFYYEKVYLFGIILGVILPDIFEPPMSVHHRKFFHSRKLFKILVLLIAGLFFVSLHSEQFFWLFFIFLGYEIHLFGDLLFHGLPR